MTTIIMIGIVWLGVSVIAHLVRTHDDRAKANERRHEELGAARRRTRVRVEGEGR